MRPTRQEVIIIIDPAVPLSRAWGVLRSYPGLALIPLLWDAFNALLLVYRVGRLPWDGPGGQFHVQFRLPSPLPAGTDLLPQSTGVTLNAGNLYALVPSLLLICLGALVTAGFLHAGLLALRGGRPSLEAFRAGARHFGGRLILWRLIVMAVLWVAAPALMALGPVLMVVALVAFLWVYLTEFLIIANDLRLVTAVSESGPQLLAQFSRLLPVFLISAGLSALATFVLSSAGLLVLLVPVWAGLGTWLTLAVLTIVDRSVRVP